MKRSAEAKPAMLLRLEQQPAVSVCVQTLVSHRVMGVASLALRHGVSSNPPDRFARQRVLAVIVRLDHDRLSSVSLVALSFLRGAAGAGGRESHAGQGGVVSDDHMEGNSRLAS